MNLRVKWIIALILTLMAHQPLMAQISCEALLTPSLEELHHNYIRTLKSTELKKHWASMHKHLRQNGVSFKIINEGIEIVAGDQSPLNKFALKVQNNFGAPLRYAPMHSPFRAGAVTIDLNTYNLHFFDLSFDAINNLEPWMTEAHEWSHARRITQLRTDTPSSLLTSLVRWQGIDPDPVLGSGFLFDEWNAYFIGVKAAVQFLKLGKIDRARHNQEIGHSLDLIYEHARLAEPALKDIHTVLEQDFHQPAIKSILVSSLSSLNQIETSRGSYKLHLVRLPSGKVRLQLEIETANYSYTSNSKKTYPASEALNADNIDAFLSATLVGLTKLQSASKEIMWTIDQALENEQGFDIDFFIANYEAILKRLDE